ncbi:hypothetical protein A3I99_00370 [Candidatus Kaiserbacteria bacterium RIFCSPLOWO2_02_FULL_45_11b]|uniref:Uncharacterized protein n=1 Tax=Candidatus Kaiserbacteria bacterium RIFCSPLOWO2_12_FULL_45_26 TaxID=1798525 RepID=A0A1F6FGD4_9BACT|nr:MAG: hypothetical protein A2Z56_02295 [Candidatus Kaiserbacteria bacterium RIFCSPHIGHO2_12_45_16]OGG70905.1 MAG: hypothetical protein A2929_00780 [Candidatus Kaiserbacteria bacterium RIFCSPLOWO2_01_FULL_45_25]OGG84235.1 MAG: hypothetical protein A3I99_00370 [Candidatus Kaiserbacteria bacterium RIFCSPLOWO2_02_FULL_45_11b]OGG84911.1 MAG: hypothetical protein A3G90_02465 [Candidatus Kaiserbacteria bacterium RIFCSPLOWO2_12_FULL_45_26]
MTNIRNNSVVLLLLVIASLLSAVHLAVASEVTGSLSSDGSSSATGTDEEAVIDGEVTAQATGQSSGQIQGTVVQGREESALLATTDSTAWNAAMWAVPLAGIAIATLVYLLWRRGSF